MAAGLIGRTGAIVTSHVTEAYNGDADNVTTRQPVGRDRNVRAMLWRLDTVTNTPVKVTTSIGTVDCNMFIACDSSGAHLKVGRPGDQTRIGYTKDQMVLVAVSQSTGTQHLEVGGRKQNQLAWCQ